MTKKTFEQSLEVLEKTVRQLETGDLTLDQSITAFEDGMKLVKECEAKLKEAKAKIEKLIKDQNGNTKIETFEAEE
ncbi:MAG: exodeoxyribonuclease VII small subunit [Pseudomonadota bacterium]